VACARSRCGSNHADQLTTLGIAPVGTVLEHTHARYATRHRFERHKDLWGETTGEWRDRTAYLPRQTPGRRRIAICPATYSHATCKSCGARARTRDVMIGFAAHDARCQAEKATAARDVPVGMSWAFRNHRTMAEIIARKTPAT
jgi:hypothetical protein